MLKIRVLSSIIGAPLLLAAVWLGSWSFALVMGLVIALATAELSSLLMSEREDAHVERSTPPFALDALTLMLAFLFARSAFTGRGLQVALVVAFVASAAALIVWPDTYKYNRVAAAWLGAVYVGWLGGHFVPLRATQDGLGLTLTVLAITWANDTAAYFVGRRFGSRKMAPTVSPNKSWEGSLAGLLASLALGVPSLGSLGFGAVATLLISATVGAAGQLGDLFESAIKRQFGFKDSGATIPGHGGILDRFDSLFLAAPVMFYLAGVFR